MTRGFLRHVLVPGAGLLIVLGLACGAAGEGAAQAGTPQPPAEKAAAPPASDNSCVACHRRVETVRAFPAWAQDQFIHWYGAVHGRAGVTCDRCHGGDPTAAAKEAAHQGMLGAEDVNSPIYYKNVPRTCGQCHTDVYEAFTKSAHYKELVADHLAPSCTTCHGFEMDTDAVTPTQLVERCTVCHNAERGVKPEVVRQARAALDEIAATKHAVEEARLTADLAEEQGADAAAARQLIGQAKAKLDASAVHWHSFNIGAFDSELDTVRVQAETARTQAMNALLGK